MIRSIRAACILTCVRAQVETLLFSYILFSTDVFKATLGEKHAIEVNTLSYIIAYY